ncbi:hypothetical protein [Bdellovibrio sp. HCB-110]|uniref:hypothetical protein n=1 Tax=Bdellovibrio sp. HCB-110 TaxID=3391182 RepID=UPI0039B620F8
MKKVLFLAVFGISSVSMAAATCPSENQQIVCVSTPKAGDQELAANVFDSIAVCTQGSRTALVPEKNGASDIAFAKVTQRIGATTYLVQTGDVDFSLSISTRINSKKSPAKLRVKFKHNNIVASSTYTCER